MLELLGLVGDGISQDCFLRCTRVVRLRHSLHTSASKPASVRTIRSILVDLRNGVLLSADFANTDRFESFAFGQPLTQRTAGQVTIKFPGCGENLDERLRLFDASLKHLQETQSSACSIGYGCSVHIL